MKFKLMVYSIRVLIIGLVIGGVYFLTLNCGYTFTKSSIESSKKPVPKSALYALCQRGAQSNSGAGNNIVFCQSLLDDITTKGKLINYEKCIKIKKAHDLNLKCYEIVFGKKK